MLLQVNCVSSLIFYSLDMRKTTNHHKQIISFL